jgi:hypothetical protein
MPDGTATAHLYRPKLIATFSDGKLAHGGRVARAFVFALVKDPTLGIVAGWVLAALLALFKRPVPEEGEWRNSGLGDMADDRARLYQAVVARLDLQRA